MNKFKAGDVVVLRSGGPRMTVIPFGNDPTQVACQWFDGANVCSGSFHVETVELVKR